MAVVRFLYRDRWREGTIIGYGSQHPDFPATDTQIDSRSFMWRSRHGAGSGNGKFVVDATCNKINFDEGGDELTGTVASDSYTGATLATAIAAAMNGAAGKTLTYACAYNESTAKFTISAGSNFTLRWNTGTNNAVDISDLCGYSDAANGTGASTYAADYRRIHWPKENLDNNLGAAFEINQVIILGHNLSSTAVIKLVCATDSAFSAGVTEDVIPWAAGNINYYLPASRSKQYARLHVEDPTNASGYVQVADFKVGKHFEPDIDFLAEYDDDLAEESLLSRSDSGNLYGQERYKLQEWKIQFSCVNADSYGEFRAMRSVCGTTRALVVDFNSASPNSAFHLVRMMGLSSLSAQVGDTWAFSMRLQEFV